jgi:hypothetical protein
MNPLELANLQAVLTALKDAPPGTEMELSGGARARVADDKPGSRGISVQNSDGSGWQMRVYQPAETPPEDYPAEMPFIPNTNMSLTHGSEGNVMAVWETPEAERLFEELSAQVAGSGWVVQPDNPMFAHLPGGLRMRELKQGERTRFIMRMNAKGQGVVAVFDA